MQNCQYTLPTLISFWEAHTPIQSDRAGDQICIFGFSRGAFTARALAGMLQKVGLLPPCNIEQLPFAYSMYARDDKEGRDLSTEFKHTFSVSVKIQFLGVWYVIPPIYRLITSYLLQGHRAICRNDSKTLAILWREQCHRQIPPCLGSR
jgi:hypothetical protein